MAAMLLLTVKSTMLAGGLKSQKHIIKTTANTIDYGVSKKLCLVGVAIVEELSLYLSRILDSCIAQTPT